LEFRSRDQDGRQGCASIRTIDFQLQEEAKGSELDSDIRPGELDTEGSQQF
jgi:hypothetical protein